MRTVKDLHEKSGLLHCDVKPGNVLWDDTNKCIRLIDFGHSQLESGARSYHATEKFEAPEIRNEEEPHSRCTDAYSVGSTILYILDKYDDTADADADAYADADGKSREDLVKKKKEDHQSLIRLIRDIGTNLAAENPTLRWSLSKSLIMLQRRKCTNAAVQDDDDDQQVQTDSHLL